MNVHTLSDKPEKIEECLELITHSFNYPDDYSYKEDFALLVDQSNHGNCYFIEQEGVVVATLFTLPRQLLYKDLQLPVLFLGGISVKDENRGGGLFRSLLETVSLLNSNFALFLLWSDLSSLYEKFSFHEFGLIEEVRTNPSQTLKPGNKANENQLRALYNDLSEDFLIPQRSSKEWQLLLSSPSIEFLQDETGSSYFVGKGFDLQGICHELHLMNEECSPQAQKYWNYSPEDKAENLRYMGFLRLGNLETLSEFIESTSKGRLKIVEKIESLIRVEFDGEIFELSDKDFIQGLWGPGKVTEWLSLVPPIRIMGFDSI